MKFGILTKATTGSAYPQHSLNFKSLNCKLLSFEIQAPKPTLEMDVWLQQHQRRQKVLWDGFLW